MTSDDEAAVVADLAAWARSRGTSGDLAEIVFRAMALVDEVQAPAVEARPEGVTLQ